MAKPKPSVMDEIRQATKQNKENKMSKFATAKNKAKKFTTSILPWLIIGAAIVFYYAYQVGHDQGVKDQKAVSVLVNEQVTLAKQAESKN